MKINFKCNILSWNKWFPPPVSVQSMQWWAHRSPCHADAKPETSLAPSAPSLNTLCGSPKPCWSHLPCQGAPCPLLHHPLLVAVARQSSRPPPACQEGLQTGRALGRTGPGLGGKALWALPEQPGASRLRIRPGRESWREQLGGSFCSAPFHGYLKSWGSSKEQPKPLNKLLHTKMIQRNEKWAFIKYLGRDLGGKQPAIWSWRLTLKVQGKSKPKPPSPRLSGEGVGAHLPEHWPLLSPLCRSHRGQNTSAQKATGTSEAEHPWQPRRHPLGSWWSTALQIPASPALVSGKGEAKERLLPPHDKTRPASVLPAPCWITESEWRRQRRHWKTTRQTATPTESTQGVLAQPNPHWHPKTRGWAAGSAGCNGSTAQGRSRWAATACRTVMVWHGNALAWGQESQGPVTLRFALSLPLSDKSPSPAPGLTMPEPEMETLPTAVPLLYPHCVMARGAGWRGWRWAAGTVEDKPRSGAAACLQELPPLTPSPSANAPRASLPPRNAVTDAQQVPPPLQHHSREPGGDRGTAALGKPGAGCRRPAARQRWEEKQLSGCPLTSRRRPTPRPCRLFHLPAPAALSSPAQRCESLRSRGSRPATGHSRWHRPDAAGTKRLVARPALQGSARWEVGGRWGTVTSVTSAVTSKVLSTPKIWLLPGACREVKALGFLLPLPANKTVLGLCLGSVSFAQTQLNFVNLCWRKSSPPGRGALYPSGQTSVPPRRSWSQNHRTTECSGLEGTSVGHPAQPSCWSRVTYSRLQRTLSRRVGCQGGSPASKPEGTILAALPDRQPRRERSSSSPQQTTLQGTVQLGLIFGFWFSGDKASLSQHGSGCLGVGARRYLCWRAMSP